MVIGYVSFLFVEFVRQDVYVNTPIETEQSSTVDLGLTRPEERNINVKMFPLQHLSFRAT